MTEELDLQGYVRGVRRGDTGKGEALEKKGQCA